MTGLSAIMLCSLSSCTSTAIQMIFFQFIRDYSWNIYINEVMFELNSTELMLTLELNNSFLGFSAHMISCFCGCLQIVPKDQKYVSEVGLKPVKH